MSRPLIYLNNAATTWPKPDGVAKALNESLELPVFSSGRTTGTQGTDYISLAREKTGLLLGGSEDQVIFTHNATDSLNILISGFIRAHQGCHVLCTALDHNSVLRPLHEYARAGECSLDIVPFRDGKISADDVAERIKADTKLMVMTHASNVIGSVQDVKGIAEVLHEKGIFLIVDGAQSAGHLQVDFEHCGADAFVFTGHKALFGITGTGGFLIKEPSEIEPTRFGGTGSFSREVYQPLEMPERFETGTQNFVGLAALCAGIDYINSRGQKAIHEQGLRQSAEIIAGLKQEDNITVHYETPEVPVISFNIIGLSCEDAGFILSRKYGVITRTGLHCAPLVHDVIDDGIGSIRISLSALTADDECNAAVSAIKEVARAARLFDSA